MDQNASNVKRLVLADDNHDNCMFFGKVVQSIDDTVQLSFVANGQDLLQLLKRKPADMVFLDLRMPGKSGYVCLKEIRRDADLRHLPVVIYSQSTNRNDIEQCFRLEADYYVVKPFTADHLFNALQVLLGGELENRRRFLKHYFINNRFVPFITIG
jgi:CheY-like chemotaxis protein